ncbi:hypothetical protein [Capillibacterium thermochitinicola]|uniref:Class IIb bacteriocin, lactobin A/cerein 7B family n=1 Tax=Capillibacterium thermochitinicola TaxID=2699427 RepID=A0A8J6LP03_9FIRM|nr:hypothetical protein [Capillibacterium thermochitinicola]MBA2134148.1 hypothetical protein [Capillibacterium thermochitinicola]
MEMVATLGMTELGEKESMEIDGGEVVILGVTVTASLVAKIVTAAATAYGAGYALGKAYSHFTNSRK